jgi:hypothetical protein
MSQSRRKTRDPKKDRLRKKLDQVKNATAKEIHNSLVMASQAIDRQTEEIKALRRIIVSERAQLIYMSDMALGYAQRRIVDLTIKNFSDLPEATQQEYVKKAIEELGSDAGMIPHQPGGGVPAETAKEADKGKIKVVH